MSLDNVNDLGKIFTRIPIPSVKIRATIAVWYSQRFTPTSVYSPCIGNKYLEGGVKRKKSINFAFKFNMKMPSIIAFLIDVVHIYHYFSHFFYINVHSGLKDQYAINCSKQNIYEIYISITLY